MSFINAIEKQLDADYNYSMTENGALGYATTNKPLLDMNFRVTSYRGMSEKDIVADFIKALNQNFELSIAWLFYARDVRQGLGERRLFRALFKDLANTHPKLAEKLVGEIPEYGRWDDLLELLDTPVYAQVITIIEQQLSEDLQNLDAGKSVSLLAKWLPSENASSAATKARARMIMNALGMQPRAYRKTLSELRKKIQIVESQMSANEWSEIEYPAIPSKANLIYKDAFLRHDKERREKYLDAVANGEDKINAAVVFPHEIAHKYSLANRYSSQRCAVDAAVEAMWKALPDYGLDNTLVVADGSGSMYTLVGGRNSNLMAIEVANALAVYAAQHCSGAFKNTYITFSSRPQLVKLDGNTLLDNLRTAYAHNEVANTNIKATFDLILNTAVANKMSQEDMPKNILILSDMEFDSATYTYGSKVNERLFDQIQREYAECGYQVPRLIFWNLCSRTGTIPVTQNKLGVALVSGFSLNIMQLVLNGELDPWKALYKQLTGDRYNKIIEVVRNNI